MRLIAKTRHMGHVLKIMPREAGFGFLQVDGQVADAFYHNENIQFDRALLRVGLAVTFGLYQTQRGCKAFAIELARPARDNPELPTVGGGKAVVEGVETSTTKTRVQHVT